MIHGIERWYHVKISKVVTGLKKDVESLQKGWFIVGLRLKYLRHLGDFRLRLQSPVRGRHKHVPGIPLGSASRDKQRNGCRLVVQVDWRALVDLLLIMGLGDLCESGSLYLLRVS